MGSQLRFSDPRYINWIRDTLALMYWKEGVEKVANTEATTFHNDLQKALGIYGAASPSCTACTPRDIPKHLRGRWHMNCQLCHPWLVQIVQNHKDQPCPNIHRDNTDPRQWAAKPWEILKCYMGYGCQSIQSAEEADAQNILTMFKKCVHFSSCTRIGSWHLVDELLTIRNFLFHSGDYLIDDAKLDADTQTMLDFLAGLTALSTHEKQAVDDAINKITELRTNRVDLSIYPDREVRALKVKHNALKMKLEQDLNTTNVKVTDLRTDIADIKQRITTAEGDITNLQTGLAEVEKEQKTDKLRITKNEDGVKSLRTDFGVFQDEHNTTKDRVTTAERDVKSLQDDQNTTKDRITTAERDVKSLQDEQNTTRERVTTAESDVKSLQDDQNTTKDRITTAERDVKSLQDDHVTTKDRVTAAERDVKSIQDEQTTTEDRVTAAERVVKSIQDEQTTTKDRATTAERDVKSLQDAHDTTKDRITTAEGDLRSMKTDVTHLASRIQKNELEKQIPGRVLNVEDLRKTLLGQYKEDTMQIPIYLLKPAKKHPVQSLYVKQQLRRIDPRGKSEHDKTSTSDDKPIDNVTDILFKDGNFCKDVFVSAEAGLGKSSLCAHLVRLWCDAHSQKDNALTASGGERDTIISSNDPNVEHDQQGNGSSALTAPGSGHDTNAAPNDLKAMKNFKLLFYINLRDVDLPDKPDDSDCDEISALIYKQHQLKDTDYSREYIVKQCMFDKSTLVVMDSLDECQIKRLPYRGKHNQSCIVTTSRPWKLESLRSQIEEKHGHQHVEIVGLEKTSPIFLVENIVKILNKEMLEEEDKEKDGSQFLDEIINEGLHDFLYIPMLLIQMLMLWFDRKPFGRSQSEIYSNVIHHQIKVAVKNKTLPEHEGKSKDDFPLFCDAESSCACKNYGELLWKVAALAFSMLFQEDRAKCLSFESTVKSFKDLTEKEVDVCLKVGLLSEHKLFAKKMTEDERKSVGFPHKTNQEYFAAVYLSHRWSETVSYHINSVIKDLDRAMELDKVLLFCNQLNPEVARELSGLISKRADSDARVQEYRQSGKYTVGRIGSPPNIDLIYKIQNIVSAAGLTDSTDHDLASTHELQNIDTASALAEEVSDIRHSPRFERRSRGIFGKIKQFFTTSSHKTKSRSTRDSPSLPSAEAHAPHAPIPQCGSGSTPKLIMADVILCKPSEWRRTEKDRSVNVAALDMAAVKSVHADAETADVTIWEMLEKQTRCLQTLVVKENKNSKINVELIHGVVMRNQATLRTLGLHGDIDSQLDLSPLGNKLADMLTRDLTCLLLHYVDLSNKQCKTLVRHVSTTDNLRQLTLSYMSSFSHEQCEMLVRHLSTTQNLRQLTLVLIKCQTHGVDSGECCDVKLQSKLELLELRVLPFKHFSFPAEDLKTCEIELRDNVPAATSAISCLTSANNLSNLREFTCKHLRDVASVRELATVLPRHHGLQILYLYRIDFCCLGDTRLSVAAAKTLKFVALWDSTITAEGLESLVQSMDAPRVLIYLSDVTIRDGDPRDFLQRLRDSPSTEVEDDDGVEYEDGEWKVTGFGFYKNK